MISKNKTEEESFPRGQAKESKVLGPIKNREVVKEKDLFSVKESVKTKNEKVSKTKKKKGRKTEENSVFAVKSVGSLTYSQLTEV